MRARGGRDEPVCAGCRHERGGLADWRARTAPNAGEVNWTALSAEARAALPFAVAVALGYSTPEIAAGFGVTASRVATRLRLLRAELRATAG